ncbi:hypothetical protein QSI15_26720, partial [Escherichia coli]|uniref:hypothetical protein n=1 Tax=Escherichia coli TaxID=562 RepID=UPI00256EC2E9
PVGPPFGARAQRRVVALLSPLMPGVGGVRHAQAEAGGVPIQIVAPKQRAGAGHDNGGAILYLHGGAFCLGG